MAADTRARGGRALPFKGSEEPRAPCPLVQVVASAQNVGASDTPTIVLIDAFTSGCSNTFCIIVSRLKWVSGGRSVAKILVADDNSNIQKMVGLALKDQAIASAPGGTGGARGGK